MQMIENLADAAAPLKQRSHGLRHKRTKIKMQILLLFVRESFRFVCVANNLRNTEQRKGISRLK
jgi:hypothetical protein